MKRSTLIVWAVVLLSMGGIASVAYIAVRLSSSPDKLFFAGVIMAFLTPTVTALLAILRGEGLANMVNGVEQRVTEIENGNGRPPSSAKRR